MKSLRRNLAAFAAVSILAVAALAADPSGTYTFAGGGRGGGGGGGGGGGTPPVNTLVLAMKDGKLTGTLTSPGRGQGAEPVKLDIKNAKVEGDTVSFSVDRPGRDGATMTSKYSGKISADAITGEVEAPGRDGAVAKRPWEAKKAAK
jgi:hypothetical protein